MSIKKLTQKVAQRHLDHAVRGLVGYVRHTAFPERAKITTPEVMEVIARFLDDADMSDFDWLSALEEIREEEQDAKLTLVKKEKKR